MRFLAVHHFSGENRGADLPGGGVNILQLPIQSLPQTGQYDWTLAVKTKSYGEICEQSGWFIAAGRNSTRAKILRYAKSRSHIFQPFLHRFQPVSIPTVVVAVAFLVIREMIVRQMQQGIRAIRLKFPTHD